MAFIVENIRRDFPVLLKSVDKKPSKKTEPIHYLDSACMSLRPLQVINKINEYYNEYPACAGRSYHTLGKRVTAEVEKAREEVRKFINAKKASEIIFTKNTTEGINLVASSFNFNRGDVVLTLDKEHNSNLIPWQLLAKKGVVHKIVKTTSENLFDMRAFDAVLRENAGKVRMVAFGLTANLDGVTIPAKDIIKRCHAEKILILLDAAQYVPHQKTDVRKLDADFLVFSGHKMCGPSGIGVLYGKEALLEKLNPFLVGGETVTDTTYNTQVWEDLPHRFEAGLQHYSGIIGLAEACRYLNKIGFAAIAQHEYALNKRLTDALSLLLDKKEILLIGPRDPKLRGSIFNFMLKNMDPHNAAMILNESRNVMVRSGAHCVHSWFNARGFQGSVRASLYFYNTAEDVDELAAGVKELVRDFS
ncbi:MAG: cysteine desulfurase [Nanoarchaeota archaeon]